jgi:hypothetical protein
MRGAEIDSELISGSLTFVCGLRLWFVKIRLMMMALPTSRGMTKASRKDAGPSANASSNQSVTATADWSNARRCSALLRNPSRFAISNMWAL